MLNPMIILKRILRTTTQNIFRHWLTSLTAILVITLLFLLLNGLIFANFVQGSALATINEKLDLALTFISEPDDFQVSTIRGELIKEFPEIRKINFIPADIAFTNFLNNFRKNNQILADWLAENSRKSPLPNMLIISADAGLHGPIKDFLAASRFAKFLDLKSTASGALATKATEKVLMLDRTLRQASLLAIITFTLLAILIIVAVLRLAIFSRATEIAIMRLTGATKQFIRLPFILEGIVFGVLAVLLGSAIFLFLLTRFDLTAFSGGLYGGLGDLLALALSDYRSGFSLLVGWQIIGAIMVGILASYLATQRYLRKALILG